jgi:hypothetical protein
VEEKAMTQHNEAERIALAEHLLCYEGAGESLVHLTEAQRDIIAAALRAPGAGVTAEQIARIIEDNIYQEYNGNLDGNAEDRMIAARAILSLMGEATVSAPEQIAWLIEWPEDDSVPVRWWNPKTGWMRDANKAAWFSRQADADAYIASGHWVSCVKSTEHKFGLAQAGTAQAPKAGAETFVTDNADGSITLDAYANWSRKELKQHCRKLGMALENWKFAAMNAATDGDNSLLNVREPDRAKIKNMIEAYSDDIETPSPLTDGEEK